MNKLYDRIYWENDKAPALNESNLNSMSKAIDDIDDRVIEVANMIGEGIEVATMEEARAYLEEA